MVVTTSVVATTLELGPEATPIGVGLKKFLSETYIRTQYRKATYLLLDNDELDVGILMDVTLLSLADELVLVPRCVASCESPAALVEVGSVVERGPSSAVGIDKVGSEDEDVMGSWITLINEETLVPVDDARDVWLSCEVTWVESGGELEDIRVSEVVVGPIEDVCEKVEEGDKLEDVIAD